MKHFSEKTLFIFDYDGTLVDSSNIHKTAFLKTLQLWDITFEYEEIAGLKTVDAIIQLLNKKHIKLDFQDIEELVQTKQKLARHMMQLQLNLFPNVFEFLHHAYNYHLLSVVSSGSKASVQSGLKQLGIFDLFMHIICAEDVVQSKPNPEGFLQALKKTSVLAKNALVFEDSSSGFLAAQTAGIELIDVRNFDWRYF